MYSSADPVLRHLRIYRGKGTSGGGIFNNLGQHFTHNSGLGRWLSVWSQLHDFYKLVRGNEEIYSDIWGNTLFTIMVLLTGWVFEASYMTFTNWWEEMKKYTLIFGATLFTIMVLLTGAVFQEFTPLLQAGEKKWGNIA